MKCQEIMNINTLRNIIRSSILNKISFENIHTTRFWIPLLNKSNMVAQLTTDTLFMDVKFLTGKTCRISVFSVCVLLENFEYICQNFDMFFHLEKLIIEEFYSEENKNVELLWNLFDLKYLELFFHKSKKSIEIFTKLFLINQQYKNHFHYFQLIQTPSITRYSYCIEKIRKYNPQPNQQYPIISTVQNIRKTCMQNLFQASDFNRIVYAIFDVLMKEKSDQLNYWICNYFTLFQKYVVHSFTPGIISLTRTKTQRIVKCRKKIFCVELDKCEKEDLDAEHVKIFVFDDFICIVDINDPILHHKKLLFIKNGTNVQQIQKELLLVCKHIHPVIVNEEISDGILTMTPKNIFTSFQHGKDVTDMFHITKTKHIKHKQLPLKCTQRLNIPNDHINMYISNFYTYSFREKFLALVMIYDFHSIFLNAYIQQWRNEQILKKQVKNYFYSIEGNKNIMKKCILLQKTPSKLFFQKASLFITLKKHKAMLELFQRKFMNPLEPVIEFIEQSGVLQKMMNLVGQFHIPFEPTGGIDQQKLQKALFLEHVHPLIRRVIWQSLELQNKKIDVICNVQQNTKIRWGKVRINTENVFSLGENVKTLIYCSNTKRIVQPSKQVLQNSISKQVLQNRINLACHYNMLVKDSLAVGVSVFEYILKDLWDTAIKIHFFVENKELEYEMEPSICDRVCDVKEAREFLFFLGFVSSLCVSKGLYLPYKLDSSLWAYMYRPYKKTSLSILFKKQFERYKCKFIHMKKYEMQSILGVGKRETIDEKIITNYLPCRKDLNAFKSGWLSFSNKISLRHLSDKVNDFLAFQHVQEAKMNEVIRNELLRSYCSSLDEQKLSHLMKFITGRERLPYLQLGEYPINVIFKDASVLPLAQNCTNTLILPRSVKSIQDLEKCLICVFEFDSCFGFA